MTNFEAVSQFNELIGNAKGAATVPQLFKQFDLITSELKELFCGLMMLEDSTIRMAEVSDFEDNGLTLNDAQASRDQAIIEIRDGIADVLVTTYGLAHRMGIDADADMKAVADSNNSKFFTGTESQAQSVEHALTVSLGIKVERRVVLSVCVESALDQLTGIMWAFVSADDSDPERPRGKLLKAPGYKPPVFENKVADDKNVSLGDLLEQSGVQKRYDLKRFGQ